MPGSEKLLPWSLQLLSLDKALAWGLHVPLGALFYIVRRRCVPVAISDPNVVLSYLVLNCINE